MIELQNNERGAFEGFLKDASDAFRMYPSEKVWLGIYNNFHPGRRFPSSGAWLVIITFFFLLTGNPVHHSEMNIKRVKSRPSITAKRFPSEVPLKIAQYPDFRESAHTSVAATERPVNKKASASIQQAKQKQEAEGPVAENQTEHITSRQVIVKTDTELKMEKHPVEKSYMAVTHTHTPAAVYPNKAAEIQKADSRFEYQLYTTPSVEFRETRLRTGKTASPAEMMSLGGNYNNMSLVTTAFNIEAGGNIIYSYNPIMRLKAGLQFNYSSYRFRNPGLSASGTITGKESGYPPLMNAAVNSETDAGINQSYQLAVPLGADLLLAGTDQIKWFAGATVQPTLVLPGNNDLLPEFYPSGAGMESQSLFRNWYLNGGVETFISVKTTAGVTLYAGPQLRYQIFPNLNNLTPFDERLYNFGIKLGVSSRF